MGENRSVSIVCFSGEYDKLYAAFTIACGAASMGMQVKMFFTFWGAQAMCPLLGEVKTTNWLQKLFGWFAPKGVNNLPLSRLNFWGLGPRLMRYLMRKQGVESLEKLVDSAKDLGVKINLCETSSGMLGLSACEHDVQSCGVSTFVNSALADNLVLFI